MNKQERNTLAQELIKLIADNPKETQNLVEWAESYLQDIDAYKPDIQQCQWCEKGLAHFSIANQTPFGDIDLICKRCFLENLYDFLEAMKDVVYP